MKKSWRRFMGPLQAMALCGLFFVGTLSFGQEAVTQKPVQAPDEKQPAEQVYENIQAFKGMRAAELQGAMSFIASSLGVDCDYCHEQDFGKDKEPAKLRAREMIRMVRQINQDSFHGEKVVNCFTCHQGRAVPVSIASISPRKPTLATTPSAAAVEAKVGSLPSVQQVLGRYVQALGGQAALDAVRSRVVKTVRLDGKDPDSTNELFQKVPGKVLLVQQSPGYSLWVGYNGQRAWAQDSDKSYWGLLNTPQRNSIMRDSELYAGSRLKSQYGNVTVAGKEKIRERETYLVVGTSPEGAREKFYFDAQTGLLVRRYIDEPTIFGWLPVQADFEDYREVDGVKMPFVVHWDSAGGAWGIKISTKVIEVRENVPIADEKFDSPPSLPSK
jgi:photosynthetic reaction center cytochrome c subunit